MAKVIFTCLVCVTVVALTSCSASRPLPPTSVSRSDQTDAAMRSERGRTETIATESVTSFAETMSDNVPVEQEGVETKSYSKELANDDLGPCIEDQEESSSDSERACHRMLEDYGPPSTDVNYKYP